jgi:glycine hydroxymethyltransferase
MNPILKLTQAEFLKQKHTLNLIASENYPSPNVLKLLGSVWSNKYAEGYPGKRYYAGCEYADEMETTVQNLALKVFDKTGEYGVNVQVLSGSPANGMVYMSVLEYGDTIMSLNVANGGHISHLHPTSNYKKFFKLVNYDVKETGENDFEVDFEDFKTKLIEHRPKLVIIGFSGYPKQYTFSKMCLLAHEYGALVLADVAHINGLIAAGFHDSPFKVGSEGADFVSMTTHKTFRGPRSAILFAKNYIPEYFVSLGSTKKPPKSLIEIINKTIFPGTSGGPHLNQIAGVGQACLEILGEDTYPDKIDFKTYSQNILTNCKSLETSMKNNGLEIVSSTENHLCLIKLPADIDSLEMQQKLERVGVITNRNSIPFDPKTPWRPSGMRFGTAALTSRGLNENQVVEVGKLIADTVFGRQSEESLAKKTLEIAQELNWWYE